MVGNPAESFHHSRQMPHRLFTESTGQMQSHLLQLHVYQG